MRIIKWVISSDLLIQKLEAKLGELRYEIDNNLQTINYVNFYTEIIDILKSHGYENWDKVTDKYTLDELEWNHIPKFCLPDFIAETLIQIIIYNKCWVVKKEPIDHRKGLKSLSQHMVDDIKRLLKWFRG